MEECLFANAQLLCFYSIRHQGAHRTTAHTRLSILPFRFQSVCLVEHFQFYILNTIFVFVIYIPIYKVFSMYRVSNNSKIRLHCRCCCMSIPLAIKKGLAMSIWMGQYWHKSFVCSVIILLVLVALCKCNGNRTAGTTTATRRQRNKIWFYMFFDLLLVTYRIKF